MPFHFWAPDTYVGAPLPIAAYLSVVGKAVGFSGLILVTVVALPSYGDVWGPALAALAAFTMTVGNVGALRQQVTRAYSAVRLLAWSSVGQAGYLLVPIASAAYSKDAEKAIGSTVAYALMYAVVNRRLRRGRPRRRYEPPEPHQRLPGPVREEPPSAPTSVLPALPRGTAAGHHRALRQGHRLRGGRRRGARLAGRGHGRQRRDRALLLPPVDDPALPPPPEGESEKHRVPAPLTAAIALTAVLGIVLSGISRSCALLRDRPVEDRHPDCHPDGPRALSRAQGNVSAPAWR